ncbi:DUF4442 domain-containing protein [Ferruginibacter yonginensis]|uniref:DUF4442 domain-containing protein n=1 Tax=Ferruginibacter yonginensis TaxID=1310416 RepID=A0ABV8QW37_9BACT
MFEQFINVINNPISFRLFLLKKLPSAFFSGVRVRYVDQEKCLVTVPYKWFSRNPFNSTYFACLSMAAEMSTGVLAMGHLYKNEPQVSMLVQKIEGTFIKKATGITSFTCDDGKRILACINEAKATGKAMVVNAYATGVDKEGNTIASFTVTWSFKLKTTKV